METKPYLSEQVNGVLITPVEDILFMKKMISDYKEDRNLFWHNHKDGMKIHQSIMKKLKKKSKIKLLLEGLHNVHYQ
jgi:hypothetical protein